MAFFVTHPFGPILTPLRRGMVAVLAALFLFVAFANAAQCLGTTRSGARCKRQTNSASGYCYQHDPGVKHCAGKAKNGSPCRNLPQPGSAYCKLHQP